MPADFSLQEHKMPNLPILSLRFDFLTTLFTFSFDTIRCLVLAHVAELADAYASGAYGETRGGSSPLVSTIFLSSVHTRNI